MRADTLGRYYKYPCPIERHALGLLGLGSEAFSDLACSARSANKIMQSLVRFAAEIERLRSFNPVRLNEDLHRGGS